MEAKSKLSKRTWIATFLILVIIPITMAFGILVLDDRKYYFISMLIILYSMIPFLMIFEGKNPQTKEIVMIAVISAIAVAGRAAFFMLPQFKPVVAVVIIAGVCLGAEAGFMVGTVTAFVSNFFFGQGPWTVWQMFCLGIIGFLAGILMSKGVLKKNTAGLCVFGGVSTFFIYGLIMDLSYVITTLGRFDLSAYKLAVLSGVIFNIIHSIATVFFLAIISKPMIEKIERVKVKYGMIQGQK